MSRMSWLFAVLTALCAVPAPTFADLRTIGGAGSGPGQFAIPSQVAVAPDGSVYVAESNNSRVQHLDADGHSLGQIGGPGTGDGQFPGTSVKGVTVTPNGDVFVSDIGGIGSPTPRIQRFSSTGAFLGKWTASAVCLASDDADRVYVARAGAVDRYAADGSLIDTIATPGTSGGTGCLTVTAAGEILITEDSGNVASRFSSSGQLLSRWAVADPGGVAVDGLGHVFVTANNGADVQSYSLAGAFESSLNLRPATPGFRTCCPGLAVSASGLLYATDSANSAIRRMDLATPSSSLTVAPNPTVPGQPTTIDASASSVTLGSPVSYAFDLNGDGAFDIEQAAPIITTSFPTRGNTTVAVRVTSARGITATSTVPVAIGPIGVTINSGAQYTNDPNVLLTEVSPPAATTMLVSNDGGFGSAVSQPFAPALSWTLDSSGPERLPKTVYVRFFGGSAGNETYQDDIILDQTPPAVEDASVSQAASTRAKSTAKTFAVRLTATDAVSGVGEMQIAVDKSKPLPSTPYKPSLTINSSTPPGYVRVRDRAGNWSTWKDVAGAKAPRARVSLSRVSLRSLLRSGLSIPVKCDAACKLKATLILRKKKKRTTVATGAGKLSRPGKVRLRAKLTRAGRRAVKKGTVQLVVAATSSSGLTTTVTRSIRIT